MSHQLAPLLVVDLRAGDTVAYIYLVNMCQSFVKLLDLMIDAYFDVYCVGYFVGYLVGFILGFSVGDGVG